MLCMLVLLSCPISTWHNWGQCRSSLMVVPMQDISCHCLQHVHVNEKVNVRPICMQVEGKGKKVIQKFHGRVDVGSPWICRCTPGARMTLCAYTLGYTEISRQEVETAMDAQEYRCSVLTNWAQSTVGPRMRSPNANARLYFPISFHSQCVHLPDQENPILGTACKRPSVQTRDPLHTCRYPHREGSLVQTPCLCAPCVPGNDPT